MTDPNRDDHNAKDSAKDSAKDDEAQDIEAQAELQGSGLEDAKDESSGGTLPANDELEAALRAASESVDARAGKRDGASDGIGAALGGDLSADKVLLEALSHELQALKGQYEEQSAEHEALKDRDLRLQAEFDNFRRRNLKERQEAHNFGHQNVVKDLLPSVDNLERAILHSKESDGGDLQGLLQGIELVLRELLGTLGKYGVVSVEAEGANFDPAIHEAIAQIEDDSVPSNTVVQVMETGYKLRDRLLRPARVVVSKKSEGSEQAQEQPESGDGEPAEGQ